VTAADDLSEIQQLSLRYASAVDRRDSEAFVVLFHPEARLDVFEPGSEESRYTRQGHADLFEIPRLIARYPKTFHFVGNQLTEISGDEATGEVYCMARHLTPDAHGGTDFVMFIRYLDRYSRGEDRVWRFDERQVRIQWTDVQAAMAGPALAG
jgi:hypothetical protein